MAIGNVTFAGMASGLPPDLVDKLVESQKTRLKSMERDKSFFTSQQTAFGELETKMLALETKAKELQDTSAWAPHTVTSSDEDMVTITADSTAQSANHTIHVAQLATYNTAVNAGVASSTAVLDAAGGTFSFVYDGSTTLNPDTNNHNYSVTVSATDTLNDLASAINALDYGDDAAGVGASVLYDGTNYRLVLTAKDSGTVSATGAARLSGITSTSNGGGSITGLATGDFSVSTPTDARLSIDGIVVTSPSNQVSDALTGVTINLKQTTGATYALGVFTPVGSGVNVTIQNDKTALKSTLNGFVDAFNGVIDYVNQHKTDTLSGESLSRSIISQMRTVLNTPTQTATNTALTPYSTLSAIGLRTDQKTGKISFDGTSLDSALSADFTSVTKLFTTKNNTATTFNEGIAHRMADLISTLTASSTGAVTGKKDGLKARLDRLEDSITRENARLEKVREALTKKFSNLEQMISKMNSSSSSMISSIQKLSGSSK